MGVFEGYMQVKNWC